MTTSLDAYRSDREKLLARVSELEGEVEKWRAYSTKIKRKKNDPFDWLQHCPCCGETSSDHSTGYYHVDGWTRPVTCRGWLVRLWRWCFIKEQHLHQRCTACGARWVVDAEGWRFD